MASRAGRKNVKSQAAKESTKAFFTRMLDNSAEEVMWKRFLDSTDEDVALKSFLRAVEYKRGKPVQPTAKADESGELFGIGDSFPDATNNARATIQ